MIRAKTDGPSPLLLTAHFSRYPLMEPQDCVKLLYQAAFGPGHIVKSGTQSLARLLREWDETPASTKGLYTEALSNGLFRVYLAPAKAKGVDPAALNAAFLSTAAQECAGLKCFEAGLALAESLCGSGLAPFSAQQLRQYLTRYRAMGCPAVSHSDAYRKAYAPHYRVVSEEYWDMKTRP